MMMMIIIMMMMMMMMMRMMMMSIINVLVNRQTKNDKDFYTSRSYASFSLESTVVVQ